MNDEGIGGNRFRTGGVEALRQGLADAYAKLHLDLRRGDGPAGARRYSFAALTTTERLIEEQPHAGAVRAIVKIQRAPQDGSFARHAIGERLFPPEEALLIAGLINATRRSTMQPFRPKRSTA
jgi:hypothetical protein